MTSYPWEEFYPDYQAVSPHVIQWHSDGDSPMAIVRQLREFFSSLYPKEPNKAEIRLKLVARTLGAIDRHTKQLAEADLVEIKPETNLFRMRPGLIRAMHHLVIEKRKVN